MDVLKKESCPVSFQHPATPEPPEASSVTTGRLASCHRMECSVVSDVTLAECFPHVASPGLRVVLQEAAESARDADREVFLSPSLSFSKDIFMLLSHNSSYSLAGFRLKPNIFKIFYTVMVLFPVTRHPLCHVTNTVTW